jgi:hypothetical protein
VTDPSLRVRSGGTGSRTQGSALTRPSGDIGSRRRDENPSGYVNTMEYVPPDEDRIVRSARLCLRRNPCRRSLWIDQAESTSEIESGIIREAQSVQGICPINERRPDASMHPLGGLGHPARHMPSGQEWPLRRDSPFGGGAQHLSAQRIGRREDSPQALCFFSSGRARRTRHTQR